MLVSGSIKANIGHLEGGSGLASILKSIKILEKGVIPPNALFEKLNPKIKAKFYHLEVSSIKNHGLHEAYRLQVPTTCVPWPTQGLRRISVDSFGFGGANSHVILDDALHTIEGLALEDNHRILTSPVLSNGVSGSHAANGVNGTHGMNGMNGTTQENSKETPRYQLLTWSARDEAALKRMLHLHDGYLKTATDGDANFLGNLAYTLATRRSLMSWRSFAVLDTQGKPEMEELSFAKCERAARDVGVAFIFTGQGAQYVNMGIELLQYPVFKATLCEIDGIFQDMGAGWSLFGKRYVRW